MENNMENAPAEIFDWMEHYTFDALAPLQKQEVMHWLSPQEYDELHFAIAGIQKTMGSEISTRHQDIKKNLLQAFDRHHGQRKKVLLFQPLLLWKVASIFLFLTSVFLVYALLHQKEQLSLGIPAAIDTVYITRDIPASAMVSAREENAGPKVAEKTIDYYRPQVEKRESTHAEIVTRSEMNILTVKELDAPPNQQKRNSIKDDSLVKHYSFTTM